jgi:Transmembrane secretion effector
MARRFNLRPKIRSAFFMRNVRLRVRGSSRFRILRPLAHRDFALLWLGNSISMLGDGIYYVAIAWQVYELRNVPSALAVVGLATTLPMVVFLLLGGVISDRLDRRRVMIAGDLVRGLAILAVGILSITGTIEFWHVIVLVAIYGVGEAFFGPAFGAIVPDIVPPHELVQANSLEQFVRPLAFRLGGPALGGWIIASVGGGEAGVAFLVDAATFGASALALLAMSPRPIVRAEDEPASFLREAIEGLRFVRSRTWLWATLGSATVTLLFFWGPFEVLLPYIVKNRLGGGADDLGLIFAVGGVGAIIAAFLMAQRGLPERHILFMYLSWTIGIASVSLYAFTTEVWQAMLISFVEATMITCGMVVWGTLIRALVPSELQGRVNSLDWLVSIGLVPMSYALTGPIARWLGAESTLLWAGILGGATTIGVLFIPGMFDTERDGSLILDVDEAELADVHPA